MPPFACAHRGLSSERTENTLAAFGAAIRSGFPAFELDLRTTVDGRVVVFHDDRLDRLAGVQALLAETTYAKVLELQFRDGPVPTLEDVLHLMGSWDGLANLELKAFSAAQGTIEQVLETKMEKRCIVSSMDADILTECRRLAPQVGRALIPLGPLGEEDIRTARELECSWVNVDDDFAEEKDVRELKAAGFKVGAWTVNNPDRAQELVRWGVDCVITDRADVHKALGGVAVTAWQ